MITTSETTVVGSACRIYERDTDALFAKLLRSRSDVADIMAQATLGRVPQGAPQVRRQVRHEGGCGSMDLVVEFQDGTALLVENKIDAAYSTTKQGHGQPQRYQESVAARRQAGHDVRSVLLAPSRYLVGSKAAKLFDAQVPYEAFLDVLQGPDLALLRDAIREAEMPYEPAANASSYEFFAAIRSLIVERYPDLVMKHDPNSGGVRPDASRTIYFDVARTLRAHAGVPRPRMSLQCWDNAARSASVKIMLPNCAALADILPIPSSLTDIGGYLRPAGRSLGIVIDTPRLDTQRLLAEQLGDVVEGLEAALRLQAWWGGAGNELRQWTGK